MQAKQRALAVGSALARPWLWLWRVIDLSDVLVISGGGLVSYGVGAIWGVPAGQITAGAILLVLGVWWGLAAPRPRIG